MGGCSHGTTPKSGFSVATAAVRDCAFDYGTADVGQGRLSFTVVNTGDTVLTVDGATLTGEAAVRTDVVLTGPIQPGASALMRLRFAPTTAGAATGSLSISSDDANLEADEDVVLALRGAGRLAAGRVRATSAAVDLGTRATCAVLIESVGDRELTLQTIALVNGGTAIFGAPARDETSLLPIADLTTLPASLAPGTAVELQVAVVPTCPSAATATLRLGSNIPSTADIDVTLRVNGLAGEGEGEADWCSQGLPENGIALAAALLAVRRRRSQR